MKNIYCVLVFLAGAMSLSASVTFDGPTNTVTITSPEHSPATSTETGTVPATGSIQQINHVIFMLQENHSFDSYFGMLNPYRIANKWNIGDDGITYSVDGIDDKLDTITNSDEEGKSYPLFKFKSTCLDDLSAVWDSSYKDIDVNDYSLSRSIQMKGFVQNAEAFAKNCAAHGGSNCPGAFTDLTGQGAMGYYDQKYLNYYYFIASQFAVSDRWFSPVSAKTQPNRVATFTGGTTQGLVQSPLGDDHLSPLKINTIFEELDTANVTWKVYYTVTEGFCLNDDDCGTSKTDRFPQTYLNYFAYFTKYLHERSGSCASPTQESSVVGDATNSFCIDTAHVAPLSTYFKDVANGTLPSFAFIESGYGQNDEHPQSGQSILLGQAQVASIVNALMTSPSWSDSVFFFSYDEDGGLYDNVPPVPGHSNDFTDEPVGAYPDIAAIAVNPDHYVPCLPSGSKPTTHCDLNSKDPGAKSTDAAAKDGFAAQLGFRMPNVIISPFTRRHYVSHIPMDHTAVIKFVENRFISPSSHLTARDAPQPDLLDFFDFNNIPWATPPTPPAAVTKKSLGYNPCTPASM